MMNNDGAISFKALVTIQCTIFTTPPGKVVAIFIRKIEIRVTTDWLLKGTGPDPENKNVIPVFDIIPANIDTLNHDLTASFMDSPPEIEADFACQINQDNMKLIGIDKGDLAFFRKTETPQPGQIIATHKINEAGVLTLHFLAKKNSQAILRSANLNHEDIPLTGEDVLDGVLIALLKNLFLLSTIMKNSPMSSCLLIKIAFLHPSSNSFLNSKLKCPRPSRNE
ncbi:hypothetical protein Ga0466249_000176 [Sporomusaceae bacterium BoRhaA]|uniref:LexA family protein n=1 Tax=Pelorhabdus rhamnosifermentans TaxID=2772457 RepID=UPI001C063B28|nr:S24 family peptidase [Pelorhabdus rhamnosifermentans]MBU2699097.1 hypothetical protein [Pelorhabdus rhamnosifermentans]